MRTAAGAPVPDVEEASASQPLLTPADGVQVPVQEHWTKAWARAVYAFLSNIGASLFFGLVTAFGLKAIGQAVAIALVLLFIGFQVLAYYGFVNFNWSHLGTAVAGRLDLNKDGKVDVKDLGVACTRFWAFVFSWGIPSVGGFLLGFWLGWRIL